MKSGLFSILLSILAIIILPSFGLAQLITGHELIPQANMLKPSVRQMVKEPMFNTNIVRLTDADNTNNDGIFPYSAKRQAWNTDESLMILTTGEGTILLYDGQTYTFKKVLLGVRGQDIFWHPTDPFLIVYTSANTLNSYNVITDEIKLIHSFTEYFFVSSRGGNLSNDGHYYAFVGEFPPLQADIKTAIPQRIKHEELVLYDLWADQTISKQVVAAKFFDVNWISVSPQGQYIVVSYKSGVDDFADAIDVYDHGFKLIWREVFGSANSDLAIDASGDEVLLIDRYDSDTNSRFIEKYRLFDKNQTMLLEHSPAFYVNISARNLTNFGWCLISTFDNEKRLTDSVSNWLPFEDEIFLLKMDGSQNVKRLAHHRSRRFSPTTPTEPTSIAFAEPQASLSRNSDRVVFASNWRENVAEPTSIDAYVVDLRGIESPLNDFYIRLSTDVLNLTPGGFAEVAIDTQPLGDFSEHVDFELAITPDGGNFGIFLLMDLNGTEKVRARIVPLGDIPANKYLLHVVGKTANKTHHAGMLINVSSEAEKDFRLWLHPEAMTIKRGDKIKVMAEIERLGGFNKEVTVRFMETKGLKIKANPLIVSTTASMASFTLKTKPKTPIGSHEVVFVATSPTTRAHIVKMILTVEE